MYQEPSNGYSETTSCSRRHLYGLSAQGYLLDSGDGVVGHQGASPARRSGFTGEVGRKARPPLEQSSVRLPNLKLWDEEHETARPNGSALSISALP